MMKVRQKKYETSELITMLRLAAALRAQMLAGGFTDNGGAIHSAERILNILGLRLSYPELSHINNLRKLTNAPFSEAALAAFSAGERVLIEHVNPHRALTRLVIGRIEAGATDEQIAAFVKEHFQLALLTESETNKLNRINRSKIDPNRLINAGILLVVKTAPKSKRVA
jgi:hypothetical protein